MSTVPKPLLTPQQYLDRERIAEFRSEFYEGEMFAMAGASEVHNLIVANCIVVLGGQLKKRPCRVYPSDLKLFIRATGLFTYPDLMVICGESEFEFDRNDVIVNPNLLVEVLSDSTEGYDRGKKFLHYRAIPSLQEVVFIAQDRASVESYRRADDGQWILSASSHLDCDHHLTSIQCDLPLADVYDKVKLEP
jgi:Uma2 family endonuclease